MADDVETVPVPDAVTALYVVLTPFALPEDGPVPPLPPTGLLLARGTPPALADRAAQLPHAWAAARDATVSGALENERAVLREALDVAARHDGLVLDVRVPRVARTTPPSGHRAADWFVFGHDGGRVGTHGLTRFGLPELECSRVPEAALAMYDAVLVGVAQRILEEWPGHDPVGPATITMRDIARGYGDTAADEDDPTLTRRVDVTLTYSSSSGLLEVTLHDDPAVALFAA